MKSERPVGFGGFGFVGPTISCTRGNLWSSHVTNIFGFGFLFYFLFFIYLYIYIYIYILSLFCIYGVSVQNFPLTQWIISLLAI